MSDSRRVNLQVSYDGVDISADITRDLTAFSTTDNASGSADDVSIHLHDKNDLWINSWRPQEGAQIECTINQIGFASSRKALSCGRFIIDTNQFSGPPTTLIIGAVGMPSAEGFKGTNRSKTFENATVERIAKTIADRYSLLLIYDTAINPTVKYIEQSREPDSKFLLGVCDKYGLMLKLHNDKLVIYDEMTYEMKPFVRLIGMKDITDWTYSSNIWDAGYTGCRISYKNPDSKDDLEYTFEYGDGKILEESSSVESIAEAEIVGKAKLREKNKEFTKVVLDMPLDLDLLATQTVYLSGDFGSIEGKYFIDTRTHDIGTGSTTTVSMHKVIEGGY